MKTLIKLFIILIFLLFPQQLDSCTIFYIEKNGVVFAGNNEDWKDPSTMMFFYPPTSGKYGWVKFGWASGFPQGGMNDHGLFWDGTSNLHLDMPYSEAHKTKLNFPIMQKVIEECSSIEDAKTIFANFFIDDQYKAQYLVGDSTGNSMIVEGDNILDKEKDYQVLTNFYQSNPELGGYPCWRFDKTCELLETDTNLNPYFIGEVLASTHQDGNYPTQYSTIYDLKNQLIYLFYYHNYEEFIVIDLKKELGKGQSSYQIPELFSKLELIAPANRITLKPSSVDFKWEGKPENSYEVRYSTSWDFSEYQTAYVYNKQGNDEYVKMVAVPAFLILILLNIRKRHLLLFLLTFVLFTGSQCEKDEIQTSDTISFSKTINNLEPQTIYYWKIVAQPETNNNFRSETIVYQFKTG